MDAMRVILAVAASVAFVSAAQAQTATTFTAGARIASSAVNSAFASKADATNGVLTTPDINGGTLDGACVGCTTQAAGKFTTLSATSMTADSFLMTGAGGTAYKMYDTSQGTDAKYADMEIGGGRVAFRFLNDAYSSSNTWLSAARSGYAITSVTITAPAIAINGTTTITGTLNVSGVLNLQAYTVATLPTCNSAANTTYAAVTDATASTYNATVTGGGAVSLPVYCNGTHWTAH